MNPQQEYYLRNNVLAPYIFYGNGKVLLNKSYEKNTCNRFLFIEIKSINKEGNDGYNIGRFDIIASSPYKTGYFDKLNEFSTYWSDYADLLQTKINNWRKEDWRAVEKENLKLVCWELLSYSQDSRFAELPIHLLDLNFQLLDDTVDFDTKSKLIDRMLNYFSLQSEENRIYKNILSAWGNFNEMLMIRSAKYSEWLVKLFNR